MDEILENPNLNPYTVLEECEVQVTDNLRDFIDEVNSHQADVTDDLGVERKFSETRDGREDIGITNNLFLRVVRAQEQAMIEDLHRAYPADNPEKAPIFDEVMEEIDDGGSLVTPEQLLRVDGVNRRITAPGKIREGMTPSSSSGEMTPAMIVSDVLSRVQQYNPELWAKAANISATKAGNQGDPSRSVGAIIARVKAKVGDTTDYIPPTPDPSIKVMPPLLELIDFAMSDSRFADYQDPTADEGHQTAGISAKVAYMLTQ